MAVCACVYCIESGDDLGPLRFRFGGVDWVGVDGRLTGPFFFHCGLWLVQGREEEIFHIIVELRFTFQYCRTSHMSTIINCEGSE